MEAQLVDHVAPISPNKPDDFLILSSSWEERCLGFAQRAKHYQCDNILLNVYENKTDRKEENLIELRRLLKSKGNLQLITSKQSNPIEGIRRMLKLIKESNVDQPSISIDVSCFTRKHLLLLLNCLDTNELLGNSNFYYSQPTDYYINENSTNAEGIRSISEIETFSGENFSSRDTILILFLNFEGRRAIALWNELQPHKTIPVVPYPSIKDGWLEVLKDQNKLLLSTLNQSWDSIEKAHPLNTESAKSLLEKVINNRDSNGIPTCEYNYIIAPMGTKAQVIGIYKFWRMYPDNVSIVYPSPIKYNEIPEDKFPTEKVWLIDKSIEWDSR
jgi:hypothetical protein